jgi:hypothetical protein
VGVLEEGAEAVGEAGRTRESQAKAGDCGPRETRPSPNAAQPSQAQPSQPRPTQPSPTGPNPSLLRAASPKEPERATAAGGGRPSRATTALEPPAARGAMLSPGAELVGCRYYLGGGGWSRVPPWPHSVPLAVSNC